MDKFLTLENSLNNKGIVKLLWTSGWDSTFRLIQLVVEKNAVVQPIYIIDTDRRSTLVEIAKISKIKKSIISLYPQAKDNILPTYFYPRQEIKLMSSITDNYKVLKSRSRLGSQYDWLSRFALQHGIDTLELSVLNDFTIYKFVHNNIIQIDDKYGNTYAINPNVEDSNPLSIFKPFRFPLFDWTKVQMGEHAKRMGYYSIMEQTWFCHNPYGGKQCGTCTPCKDAIKQGMSYRMSKGAILRYKVEPIIKILKKIKERLS